MQTLATWTKRDSPRQASSSLPSHSQDRLQTWRLRLTIHHPALHARKFGAFQEAAQFDFRESEPGIGVKIARLLEAVLLQIQNHNAPTWFQQACGRRHGP